ncbi:MAG: helix-turn-helix transcriptional regulator [Thiotrichales bacterium]|jgi:transcriptional regulator with XRE-family HTH domain|nr:helix-turn-helix transcriptional regulator [Thiotrichales bacterium]MBT4262303.1 helix-turn-helix transcriptional regulator [Thiotrichales bacterium]
MGERIKRARNREGISQMILAERMGVTPGGCGHWERNFNTPSVENIAKLAVILNISFEWLATGRGEMEYSDEGREQLKEVGNKFPPKDELKLIREYRQISIKKRELVANLVSYLT